MSEQQLFQKDTPHWSRSITQKRSESSWRINRRLFFEGISVTQAFPGITSQPPENSNPAIQSNSVQENSNLTNFSGETGQALPSKSQDVDLLNVQPVIDSDEPFFESDSSSPFLPETSPEHLSNMQGPSFIDQEPHKLIQSSHLNVEKRKSTPKPKRFIQQTLLQMISQNSSSSLLASSETSAIQPKSTLASSVTQEGRSSSISSNIQAEVHSTRTKKDSNATHTTIGIHQKDNIEIQHEEAWDTALVRRRSQQLIAELVEKEKKRSRRKETPFETGIQIVADSIQEIENVLLENQNATDDERDKASKLCEDMRIAVTAQYKAQHNKLMTAVCGSKAIMQCRKRKQQLREELLRLRLERHKAWKDANILLESSGFPLLSVDEVEEESSDESSDDEDDEEANELEKEKEMTSPKHKHVVEEDEEDDGEEDEHAEREKETKALKRIKTLPRSSVQQRVAREMDHSTSMRKQPMEHDDDDDDDERIQRKTKAKMAEIKRRESQGIKRPRGRPRKVDSLTSTARK
ncbi:uncharacterized protein MONOS_9076p2 [Monocercomonoides exilis]|uniref:uncharacterized protein n=1 Tax=Monocercomonoides exilis TaxID=2049356 RepID=UPI00355AAFB7|nr:hypothetical protein MONOS_9076p2 [Monocercomonoides exilis]